MESAGGKVEIYAGVEIKLDSGWKTYWRNPGDAGGLAPSFDFSASKNLLETEALYPAPKRLTDASGQNIGYKTHVVFPVRITPRQAAAPVDLAMRFDYGICREICVPVEARLSLTISPDHVALPRQLMDALARVPHKVGKTDAASLPRLAAARAILSGEKPRIEFEVAVSGAGAADLFAEGPPGTYLPMAVPTGPAADGVRRFAIDLKDVGNASALVGKVLRLTMTHPGGATETEWTIR